VTDLCDLVVVIQNSFGKEKTCGKFKVCTGRPHCDGDGSMLDLAVVRYAKANLKRFLNRHKISLFKSCSRRRDLPDMGGCKTPDFCHEGILANVSGLRRNLPDISNPIDLATGKDR